MRLVDRKTFLKLPPGVIYCKGIPMAFEGLCIKGETLGNDWVFLDPAWIGAHDSGEAMSRLDEMLEEGASYPMEDAWGRDGCFEDAAIFLIFDPADLKVLREYIETAIGISA